MKGIIHALTLSIVFVFLASTSFAQSKFDEGFSDGYKKGYCHEKANCIPPTPPIAPTPTVSEKLDSYQDGYNRGFKMGLEAQKGSTSGSSRKGYKTASADPIDYTYKPTNSKVQQNISKNKNAIFEKIMDKAQEYYDKADYVGCIKACKDAIQITSLASKRTYTLMAKSYEALGKKGKAKKYYKKVDKM